MSLAKLCQVTRIACDILSPVIYSLYGSINSETAKLKSDNSAFTIADGLVQHLFKDHLFGGGSKFLNIVGEEDESKINILTRPFMVDDLIVPEEFCSVIESTRMSFQEMAKDIDTQAYKGLTIFIDPIDGTREFSTGLGEQCSICIGFADSTGHPVAGVVYRKSKLSSSSFYRYTYVYAYIVLLILYLHLKLNTNNNKSGPLTVPTTYAAGAAHEGYTEQSLNMLSPANPRGLLTSNGSVSPFLVALMKELGYERVPSGGAGNKMLMLLEGRGSAYIQDRYEKSLTKYFITIVMTLLLLL
jgi:3'-phosphoadenosine 5'-phosphosulfate (PAPS) 3'-phosphatase